MKEDNVLYAYFPLWGATFDSEDIGVIGDIAAFIPEPKEWKQIQKSDVWLERFSWDWKGPKPPLCLLTYEKVENCYLQNLVERFQNEMNNNARDAILALRLFKSGWFLDPELCEQIFVCDTLVQRVTGPYRQISEDNLTDTPQGYELKADELLNLDKLSHEKNKVRPLTRIWQLVNQYRKGRTNASTDIAIENFHRSYGYRFSGARRASFLFVAIDAILGGMSKDRIGNTLMKSTFRDRVASGLDILTQTVRVEKNLNPETEADWLDTEGRGIRNALSHGRSLNSVEVATDEESLRIQSIVRLLIRQYLEFGIKWNANSQEIGKRIGVSAETSPKAAYNKALDAYALGIVDKYDLLQVDISA
jgi:hypothetical protein